MAGKCGFVFTFSMLYLIQQPPSFWPMCLSVCLYKGCPFGSSNCALRNCKGPLCNILDLLAEMKYIERCVCICEQLPEIKNFFFFLELDILSTDALDHLP